MIQDNGNVVPPALQMTQQGKEYTIFQNNFIVNQSTKPSIVFDENFNRTEAADGSSTEYSVKTINAEPKL